MDYRFNTAVLNRVLKTMLREGEWTEDPCYVEFESTGAHYGNHYGNQYGFIATTNEKRLLVAVFDIAGKPKDFKSYPLEQLTAVKIKKIPIVKMYVADMIFTIDKKTYIVHCSINKKIFGTDLKSQSENTDRLLNVLQKWAHDNHAV